MASGDLKIWVIFNDAVLAKAQTVRLIADTA
jgi:hypothetical protein